MPNEGLSIPVSSLALAPGAETVRVGPFYGNEFVCPSCEKVIPNRKLIYLAKPPKYTSKLNDVVKCCWCKFIFCYRDELVTALRQ